MRAAVGTFALLLLAPAAGSAQPSQPRACTIETAVDDVTIENVQRQGTIAKNMMPLLRQMQEINAKATVRNKPLSEQLSPADAARFAQISERIGQTRLTQYVESSRARDAGMVQKMFDAVWNDYSGQPDKMDKNDWAVNLILSLRQLPDSFEWHAQVDGKGCSIDDALAVQEDAATGRASRAHALMPSIAQQAAAIWTRNGVTGDMPKDMSKLPPSDARALQALVNQLGPMLKDAKLSGDIAHIRIWWAISDLEYRDRKEDLLNYADADHLGDTLKSQMASMSESQKALAMLWDTTDNNVPNDAARMAAPAAEIAREDQERQTPAEGNQARH